MKNSKLALASLFFGLALPLVLLAFADRDYLLSPWENFPKVMCLVFLAPIAAITCGHLARLRGKSSETLWQKCIAIGGLLLGYAGILAIASYPIVYPNQPHFESTAVGSLRTLNMATHGFANVHGHFPGDLSELACAHDSQHYDWCIDSLLANGTKGAYRFTYTLRMENENHTEGYEIHADPRKSTRFTRYHFYTDQSGAIRYESDKPAALVSTPLS
jgi:hypothetical protein